MVRAGAGGRRTRDRARPGLRCAAQRRAARARCEFARFQSFPSSATVRSSPVGDEDRVVAEALVAAALLAIVALENPGAAQLRAFRAERDELADVAGAAVVDAVELGEQLPTPSLGPARRLRFRAAPPSAATSIPESSPSTHSSGGADVAAEARLRARVLVVRLAVLGRKVALGSSSSSSQPGSAARSSSQLVRVPRREPRLQRSPLHALDVVEVGDASATRADSDRRDARRTTSTVAVVAELDSG